VPLNAVNARATHNGYCSAHLPVAAVPRMSSGMSVRSIHIRKLSAVAAARHGIMRGGRDRTSLSGYARFEVLVPINRSLL